MDRAFEVRYEELMAECRVSPELFEGAEARLREFVEPFARCLGTPLRVEWAQSYVAGLVSDLEYKNIESIAYLHDQDRQPLQRFIGAVPWDHRPILSVLWQQVGGELGEPEGVIVFDPSAHSKKGTESVGVQRQWSGRQGKVDNCQVGIYMGYVSRREQALVNERLYLPKSWANSRARRKKCGVPEDVRFATRQELSLEMLREAGPALPHAWVAGDEELGRSTQFRRDFQALKERYLLAVPCNTRVRILEDAPALAGQEDAPPQEDAAPAAFQRADRWRAALPESAWTRIDVRDGEKGPLLIHVVSQRVLAITEREHPESEELLVVVRRSNDEGATVYDYLLSNAASDTPRAELARVANAEHRVEECIKRAKSEAGLSDYETRTWWGWHHHQTLSLLATWFLVQEARLGKKIHASPHRPTSSRSHRQAPPQRHRPTSPGTHRPRMPAPTRTKRTSSLLPPQKTQHLTAATHPSATIA
jgi:SRSO17 transposase